jgi:hypothetical protein
LSLYDLLPIRALGEKVPSAYLYDVLARATGLFREAGEELERRRKLDGIVEGEFGWQTWLTGQKEVLLAPFFEWQREEERQAREEIRRALSRYRGQEDYWAYRQ